MQDTIQKFLFEQYGIRGELVKLQHSYLSILERHPYPAVIQQYLGQLLVSASLLSGTIKYEGSIIIQTSTEGSIKQLVAQCDNQYHIRGLAVWDEQVAMTQLEQGKGHLAITILPKTGKDRYQGVVNINEQALNKSIENYFEQSEQLLTRLWLFADEHHAAGLLLQKMPDSTAQEYPMWENACTLADTITAQELFQLDNQDILHRLFHEQDIRLFKPYPISFQCNCSIEKMEQAVVNLGYEDAQQLLSTHETIQVHCEFCNKSYQFDKVDIARIFHR